MPTYYPINLRCPKCDETGNPQITELTCMGDSTIIGIFKCNKCQTERPITVYKGALQEIAVALPGVQSDKLLQKIPDDIREDVREAERANCHQCHKAAAAMCRRALQLALIDKNIQDQPLGKMLEEARNTNLLDQKLYDLATSIKGYGDIAVHRREQLDPQDVNMLIHAAVRMLDKLYS